MSQAVFDRLRALVLASMGDLARAIANQTDVVPIEQTQDGWFCLLRNGYVAHLDINGANKEFVEAHDRKLHRLPDRLFTAVKRRRRKCGNEDDQDAGDCEAHVAL